MAIPTLTKVKAQTTEATVMSAPVMCSFSYVGEMSGPQGLNEVTFRNSSFIACGEEMVAS